MKQIANIIFLVIFLAFLVAVTIGTVLSPKSSDSYWENRRLTDIPPLTADSVLDGSFFIQVEKYFSDHIVWRDSLVKLNTWLDLKLGRPVVNDLVAGSDVILSFHGYNRWDLAYLQTLAEEMGERLAGVNKLVKSYGGYFCYLGVPQQYSYYADYYPNYMDNRQWTLQPTRQAFADTLSQRDIPYVDMLKIYDELGHPDEFYSGVDHHYSYAGALVAYEALMERVNTDTGLELSILREGDGLELICLPNHYLGSLSRELYDLWPSDEKAVISTLSSEIPFTRFDNGVQVESTLYALPKTADDMVLYSLYMGGDVAETIIRTERPELPTALIFGESYTNAVETVLWTAFDETHSLDLRYYTYCSLEEYIAAYQPDVVICLRDDTSYLSNLELEP